MNNLLTGYDPLEICVDASVKEINGRTFTSSGAICTNTQERLFKILADSTNNRGELVAVYTGIQLAIQEILKYPGRFSRVNLYSDSQFCILGIRDWFSSWIKTKDSNGIIYGKNGPVKNQELFLMIISYCVTNNLTVHFYNQKGHADVYSKSGMDDAANQFKQANGFFIRYDELYKLCYYNNLIDKESRKLLDTINPDNFPILNHHDEPKYFCNYIVDNRYKNYIK